MTSSIDQLDIDLDYLIGGIDCHVLLEHVCAPREGLYVLEAGCGSGKLGLWYAIKGVKSVLFDINPEAVKYAKALAVKASFAIRSDGFFRHTTFRVASIHKIPYEDNTFDFVFNEGISQHWGRNPHDWRRQHSINEMVRVVKRGCSICIIGGNGLNLNILRMAEEISHNYRGMPAKQKPFTPEELMRRLYKAGLEKESIRVSTVSPGEWSEAPLLAGWGVKC